MLEDKQNQPEFNTANYTSQERVPLLRFPPDDAAPIFPKRVLAYFDRLHVRLTSLLPKSLLWDLQDCCADAHQFRAPLPFSHYTVRLDLKLPTMDAYELLDECVTVYRINHTQPALDFIFANAGDKEESQLFHRWHGLQSGYRHPRGPRVSFNTRYTAPRESTHVLLDYADQPCRITGDPHCLHVEWRTQGLGAVRKLGIVTWQDVLDFDHNEFWSTRLHYRSIGNIEKLGRVLNNVEHDSARHTPWTTRLSNGAIFNYDLRRGGMAERLHPMQTLLTLSRFKPARKHIAECLAPFSVTHLLPTTNGYGNA